MALQEQNIACLVWLAEVNQKTCKIAEHLLKSVDSSLSTRHFTSWGVTFYKCVKKRVVLISEIYVWEPCFRVAFKWVEMNFKRSLSRGTLH